MLHVVNENCAKILFSDRYFWPLSSVERCVQKLKIVLRFCSLTDISGLQPDLGHPVSPSQLQRCVKSFKLQCTLQSSLWKCIKIPTFCQIIHSAMYSVKPLTNPFNESFILASTRLLTKGKVRCQWITYVTLGPNKSQRNCPPPLKIPRPGTSQEMHRNSFTSRRNPYTVAQAPNF